MSPIWYWVSPIWSDLVIRVTACYNALVILVFLISNAKRRNRRTILTKSESKSSSKTRGDHKKAAADAQRQRTCTDQKSHQRTKKPVARPANCQSVDVWRPAVVGRQISESLGHGLSLAPPSDRLLYWPALRRTTCPLIVVNTLGELQWQAAAAS